MSAAFLANFIEPTSADERIERTTKLRRELYELCTLWFNEKWGTPTQKAIEARYSIPGKAYELKELLMHPRAGIASIHPDFGTIESECRKGWIKVLQLCSNGVSVFYTDESVVDVLTEVKQDTKVEQLSDEFSALRALIVPLKLSKNQSKAVELLCDGKGSVKFASLKEEFRWGFSSSESNWDSLAGKLNGILRCHGWNFFRKGNYARVEKFEPVQIAKRLRNKANKK